MDLALNNLQRLIYHKKQPTNQPTNQPTMYLENAWEATTSQNNKNTLFTKSSMYHIKVFAKMIKE